jgi:hypothetical protein
MFRKGPLQLILVKHQTLPFWSNPQIQEEVSDYRSVSGVGKEPRNWPDYVAVVTSESASSVVEFSDIVPSFSENEPFSDVALGNHYPAEFASWVSHS